MRDPFGWSVHLGRWGEPTVRLHVSFLVFVAATFFLAWQDASHSASVVLFRTVSAALAVLFLSVLAHEWSHWLVARRYDMAPSVLVVGPLGGVSDWEQTTSRRGESLCMLAGPVANLLICLLAGVWLWFVLPPRQLVSLWNPLELVWMDEASSWIEQGLILTFWINWLLLLVNMLPAYPFDGGRLLSAALGVVRPGWEKQQIAECVFWCAMVVSSLIMLAALVLWKREAGTTIFPLSFALLLLAVVLLVSARRDWDNVVAAGLASACEADVEGPCPLAADRDRVGREDAADSNAIEDYWLSPPVADATASTPEEIEAREKRQVDQILSRLHSGGWDCLTAEERWLLQRASVRYRNRLGRRT